VSEVSPRQAAGHLIDSRNNLLPLEGEDKGGGEDLSAFPLTLSLSLRGEGF